MVLDETFVTPNTSHQCLERARRWLTGKVGKLFMHAGTQSTVQTISRHRPLDEDGEADNVVLISEYTGGGFGSKITASIHVIIPAVLSKKCNAPVMMRVSREEEHFHRPRPTEPVRTD